MKHDDLLCQEADLAGPELNEGNRAAPRGKSGGLEEGLVFALLDAIHPGTLPEEPSPLLDYTGGRSPNIAAMSAAIRLAQETRGVVPVKEYAEDSALGWWQNFINEPPFYNEAFSRIYAAWHLTAVMLAWNIFRQHPPLGYMAAAAAHWLRSAWTFTLLCTAPGPRRQGKSLRHEPLVVMAGNRCGLGHHHMEREAMTPLLQGFLHGGAPKTNTFRAKMKPGRYEPLAWGCEVVRRMAKRGWPMAPLEDLDLAAPPHLSAPYGFNGGPSWSRWHQIQAAGPVTPPMNPFEIYRGPGGVAVIAKEPSNKNTAPQMATIWTADGGLRTLTLASKERMLKEDLGKARVMGHRSDMSVEARRDVNPSEGAIVAGDLDMVRHLPFNFEPVEVWAGGAGQPWQRRSL